MSNQRTRPERDLSKSEWVLMAALWDRERGSATEIQRDLEDSQGWAYSTVKTMLDRLVEKGFVSYRRIGNVYEYFPNVRRASAISRAMDEMIDRMLGGSVAPFLSRLLERGQLKSGEVDELRVLLDEHHPGPEDDADSADGPPDQEAV